MSVAGRSVPLPRTSAGPERVTHRQSHRDLLAPIPAAARWSGRFDAIAVPAHRDVSNLRFAADLAAGTGWPLFVLCSHEASAEKVLAWLQARGSRVDAIAVDVDRRTGAEWLEFSLARHPDIDRVDGYADRSHKRNIALLVARLSGWRRMLFLDDDMRDIDDAELRRAADALHVGRPHVRAVGWMADRFPDNSVVCHANRRTGVPQDTFVGAHSLGIEIHGQARLPFFPPVYNEDWLFLFDLVAAGTVALAGRSRQAVYDPFADAGRATREEFGDVLAEGLMETVHRSVDVTAALSRSWWEPVLAARHELLTGIWSRLRDLERHDLAMEASIAAAGCRLEELSADSLASFVATWRHDLESWHRRLAGLPRLGSPAAALGWLGVNWASTRD